MRSAFSARSRWRVIWAGAAREVQWQSPTLGSHHQARKFDVALSVGGSGPGHRAQLAGVAQSKLPSDDAPGTEDGKGGNGSPTRPSFVLDVASKVELRATQKFGSHAGEPGNRDGVM